MKVICPHCGQSHEVETQQARAVRARWEKKRLEQQAGGVQAPVPTVAGGDTSLQSSDIGNSVASVLASLPSSAPVDPTKPIE